MRRLAVCMLLAWPLGAQGQSAAGVPLVTETRFAAAAITPSGPLTAPVPEVFSTPGGAFAASLVVPGAGQAALGAPRWVAYGVLEVTFWAVRLSALADRREATHAYRDLAWDEARIQGEHPRREGSWGYYETMTRYERSGAFDLDPSAPGIQPEEDPSTYNGTVWALAMAIYLPGGAGAPGSPEYDSALAYYGERAAGPAFLWSWEGSDGAWARFRSHIDEADSASRRAGIALGAVLANHVTSAVDAFIIARLRSDPGIRLESRVSPAPLRWSIGLNIPIQDR